MAKRRIAEEFSHFDLLIKKTCIVLVFGVADRRVRRKMGLDDYLSFKLASSSSSCDLSQELKGFFRGSKIGDVERAVSV